jgi:hypothetical protein
MNTQKFSSSGSSGPIAGLTNTAKKGFSAARNTSYRAYGTYQEMSTLGKILTIILVIALFIALGMWIRYTYNITVGLSQNSPYLITRPVHAYASTISSKSFTVPDPIDGLSFTYSLWIYIKDWDYKFGQMKNILIKGTEDDSCPMLELYANTNSLRASIKTFKNNESGDMETCDVQNIPLNKWVNIVYVLNNRNVDIYIDSKLERSCVLQGVPKLNRSPVRLAQNGGFNGLLSNVRYFNRPLRVADVEQVYSQGPAVSGSSFRFFHKGHIIDWS